MRKATNKTTTKTHNEKVIQEFKELMEKAAIESGVSKIDLLVSLGYKESNAKQLFSNAERNLPAYLVPDFCKQAGNNLIAEWIAEQLCMELVPIDSSKSGAGSEQPQEVQQLKKELDEYKKLVAELYRDLKKS